MLSPEEYKQVMKELQGLSDWRGRILEKIPLNQERRFDRESKIRIEVRELLSMVDEIAEIEIDIRKKICGLTPSLPTDFKQPSFKNDPESAKKKRPPSTRKY